MEIWKTGCLSCWQQKLLNRKFQSTDGTCDGLRKENDLQMQTALAELDQEGLELLTAGKVWPEFVVSTSSVVAHFRRSRWEFKLLQVKELSHQIFLKAVVSLVLANSMFFFFNLLQVLHMCVYIYNIYIFHTAITTQQYNNWQQPFCWLHSDDVFFYQTSVATFLRLRSSSAEADLPAPCRGPAKTCCGGRLRKFSRRDWRQRRPNWENRSSGLFGCFLSLIFGAGSLFVKMECLKAS